MARYNPKNKQHRKSLAVDAQLRQVLLARTK